MTNLSHVSIASDVPPVLAVPSYVIACDMYRGFVSPSRKSWVPYLDMADHFTSEKAARRVHSMYMLKKCRAKIILASNAVDYR